MMRKEKNPAALHFRFLRTRAPAAKPATLARDTAVRGLLFVRETTPGTGSASGPSAYFCVVHLFCRGR
eukprot:scaffold3504_cov240-Pinguiococcus_pyrenoidosus.AAC.65